MNAREHMQALIRALGMRFGHLGIDVVEGQGRLVRHTLTIKPEELEALEDPGEEAPGPARPR